MKSKTRVMLMFCVFSAFAIMGTDLYVPSLPHITHYFLTTTSHVKLTITFYMLGLSLAPLFFGPMSDRFGRRPVLLVASSIALVGSGLAVASMTINELIVARFIQSIGFGGVLAVTRVVASDLFKGEALARVAGVISLCMSFGPAIAPIMGSYLYTHCGWRSVFMMIFGVVGVLSVGLFYFLDESTDRLKLDALKLETMLINYDHLLRSSCFIGNMMASSLAIATIIVYASMSPFILQGLYGMSAVHFGWAMACVTAMAIFSRYLNLVLLRRFASLDIIVFGLTTMGVGGGIMLLLAMCSVHTAYAVICPAMLMIIGTGLVPANAMVNVFNAFRERSASVTALYGCLTMFGAFLATGLASMVTNTTVMMAGLLCMMSCIALAGIRYAIRASAVSTDVAQA